MIHIWQSLWRTRNRLGGSEARSRKGFQTEANYTAPEKPARARPASPQQEGDERGPNQPDRDALEGGNGPNMRLATIRRRRGGFSLKMRASWRCRLSQTPGIREVESRPNTPAIHNPNRQLAR